MNFGNQSPLLMTVLLLAGQASADITQAEWTSDTDFTYAVSYMPDLDQKRSGLACNGNMFCVPTSTMNLFAYAAEWGFDDLDPGPGVWQGDIGYGPMTFWIGLLGEDMDTSEPTDPDEGPCDDGTSGTAWLNATLDWLDGYPINRYRIGKNAANHYCPTLSTAANWASYGAIVNICYGRYNVNPGSLVLGDRTGGHCVTVTYAHADGPGVLELYVRDPADDDDLDSQSPWAYNIFDVETMTVQEDWDDNASYFQVPVTMIDYDEDDDRVRFIDSVHVLRPWLGYSWSQVELNIDPVGDDFGIEMPTYGFEVPQGFVIADVAQGFPQQIFYVLVSQGQTTKVQTIDPITGQEGSIASLSGATDLVVDRRGKVYVLAGTQLYRLSDKGQVEHIYQLPWPCQAMALRDTTDELYVYSSTIQEMLTIDLLTDQTDILGFVPLPPSADPSIAVRERDGAIAVVAVEFGDQVFGVRLDVQPQVDVFHIPGLARTGVAFDDHEHLVVSMDTGEVRDFEPGIDDWWDWNKAVISLYEDAKSNGDFRISKSRTNYDPVLNAVDDIEIPADKIEYHGTIVYECTADLNGDGVLNILDFVTFQALWQAKDTAADCDFNGVFNILDFVCYQQLFKAGCP